ncbi:hypothetical protein C1H46_012064 [Malus baccata]|uniref:Uncharacterized protein n=1 Tax=Malus baccata TaxID=106549 RepID=A0A540MU21_MALBA|nr:hypothetical protein C1H46_012064 [Malus baccata]
MYCHEFHDGEARQRLSAAMASMIKIGGFWGGGDSERLEEKWVTPADERRLLEALGRTRFLALRPWKKQGGESRKGEALRKKGNVWM